MKRIFSFLFAIIALVGATSVFTSCQEDAPEINFTINITVNNDFTEVVNAINNGTMKQEAAIAALTAAINQMNGDQAAKLQALIEAINTLATTLDAKLAIIEAAINAQTLAIETKLALLEAAIDGLTAAIDQMNGDQAAKLQALIEAINTLTSTLDAKLALIEAAMKAQTLALETKLDLLEAAIKALPDYTDQLKAIEAAIKGLPDYSDKLAAIQTALAAIADNIKAQEGQYADDFAALKEAIDAITAAVEAGNKSQDEALAEIIALLESGAIAGGGSGSGSEGEGGEGEGTIPSVSFITSKSIGETISITLKDSHTLSEVVGAKYVSSEQEMFAITHTYELTSQAVILRGEKLNDMLILSSNGITSLDLSKAPDMIYLNCCDNELTYLDVSNNKKLQYLACSDNPITPENMTKLVGYLVDRKGKSQGVFNPKAYKFSEYGKATVSDVKIATDKNWKVCYADHTALYPGESTYQSITVTTSKAIGETIVMTVQGELAASEVEGADIIDSETYANGNTEYEFELKNQTVTIKQASIAYVLFTFDQITSVDLNCSELSTFYCYMNAIKGENMTNLVKDLPDRTGKTAGKFVVYASNDSREENVITKADVAIAKAKNWNVLDWDNNEYEGI